MRALIGLGFLLCQPGCLAIATAVAMQDGYIERPIHMTLTAPSPDAPFEERLAAYDKLKLAFRIDSVSKSTRTPAGTSATSRTGTKKIRLNDGSDVYFIEDLLPLVRADSIVARYIEEERQLRENPTQGKLRTYARMQYIRDAAFLAYDVELQRYLGICDAGGLIDCAELDKRLTELKQEAETTSPSTMKSE